MTQRLKGKIALVTGASRGIGRAIAIALGREGAKVALTYHHKQEEAESVAAYIRSQGGEALCLQGDVSRSRDVQGFLQAVTQQWGALDILVNNAGILQLKAFAELTEEDWDTMMAVDLKSVFLSSQAAWPLLKERRGVIVNLSSVGGQTGGAMSPHYAAAKAAVISLTRSLSKIMAKDGIRVNAIAPGYIRTDMFKEIAATQEPESAVCAKVPLGTVGRPQDVADAVVYLASSESAYVTGQVVNVNGGVYFG